MPMSYKPILVFCIALFALGCGDYLVENTKFPASTTDTMAEESTADGSTARDQRRTGVSAERPSDSSQPGTSNVIESPVSGSLEEGERTREPRPTGDLEEDADGDEAFFESADSDADDRAQESLEDGVLEEEDLEDEGLEDEAADHWTFDEPSADTEAREEYEHDGEAFEAEDRADGDAFFESDEEFAAESNDTDGADESTESMATVVPSQTSATGAAGATDFNDTGTLLAIGDSVLEWNIDAQSSIPDVVAARVDLESRNEAIGGSRVLDAGQSGIPQQYIPGDWEWVIIDGGANDVGDACGCGACMTQVDRIISPNTAQGAMPELIGRVRADGAKVVLLGYYSVLAEEYGGCGPELLAFNDRYRRLAADTNGVYFVDMGRAIARGQNELLDSDGVHPSVAGSAAVGRLIADLIARVDGLD